MDELYAIIRELQGDTRQVSGQVQQLRTDLRLDGGRTPSNSSTPYSSNTAADVPQTMSRAATLALPPTRPGFSAPNPSMMITNSRMFYDGSQKLEMNELPGSVYLGSILEEGTEWLDTAILNLPQSPAADPGTAQ